MAGPRMIWTRLLVAAVLGAAGPMAAALGAEPIVIGQSLPLTGAGFTASNRILAGAKAAVESVNAAGGLAGRPIQLVTLDDANDPKRYADNAQRLTVELKSVALLNCLGDTLCAAAAAAAEQHKVPLVGPISGLKMLRSAERSHIFSIRPDTGREAQALAAQLFAQGISRAALLSDQPENAERTAMLLEALRAKKIDVDVLRVPQGNRNSLVVALKQSSARNVQTLLVDLGLESSDALGLLSRGELDLAPKLLASLATPGLTTLIKLFQERVIGFTTVVPNPEVPDSQLVRNLTRDADRYAVEALTFEGLEAYLNTLACIEAIRRAGPRTNAGAVTQALHSLGRYDAGGFVLNFGKPGRSASDWVSVGLRARNGNLLR